MPRIIKNTAYRSTGRILSCALLMLLSSVLETAGADATIQDGDLILFLQRESAATGSVAELGDTPVQLLNEALDGRRVIVADVQNGWSLQLPAQRQHTLELLVLDGTLSWDDDRLGMRDYAYLPSTAAAPVLSAGSDGASFLVFLDLPRESDGSTARVLNSDAMPWRPGVVAKKDTGQALKLEVKDLLWVESTGQRTWLLRAGSDLQVPWEIHDGVEEGYLLEGDYRIGECLPGDAAPLTADYAPGGYFYRPGGIVHSGPESGSKGGALWLLRTPTRLTVDFVAGCPRAEDISQ